MKATGQYFPVILFIMLYKVVLTFESVDEILKFDHSNKSYLGVLSCGIVYYAVHATCFFYPLCTSLWTFSFFVLNRKAIVHRLSAQMNLFQAPRLYVQRSRENLCKVKLKTWTLHYCGMEFCKTFPPHSPSNDAGLWRQVVRDNRDEPVCVGILFQAKHTKIISILP